MRKSRLYTRPLVICLAITAMAHAATYLLNAVLPLHVVALGGSKTQVGMLFSVSTVMSMFLRPLVGGWNDCFGFRAVVLPGVAVFALTLLAFQWAGTPAAVVALMAGVGLGNGLISTSAGVLAARASAPEHRGEALSIYYVATSVALAIGPPVGFALYRAGGMRISLLVADGLALAIGLLAWSLRDRAAQAVPGARPAARLYSRHALAVAGTMILTNIGHSSVYAFLPLYAIANGMGSGIGWFYSLFSAWLIVCRIVLRRASDRLGRSRVVAVAIGTITLAYFVLAWRPSVLSLAAGALLLGSGAALLYPTLVALLVDRTPEAERGLAIGTLSASWDVGVVIGSLLVGFTVERTSYAAGFALAGVAAVLGLAAFLATERRRARGRVVPRPSAEVSF
jgi:MFS family permease